MIRLPRAPRIRRSTIFIIVAVAALAFPLGVLANHQFNDVPTAASYHDDVEALVDAGITSGCGGGNYCPNSPVTRGQMAQFLNRLGSLDGSTTPSVHADTANDLLGWAANELTRAAFNSTTFLVDGAAASSGSLTASINAPAPGWLLIDSHAELYNETSNGSDTVHCQLEVNNALVPGTGVYRDLQFTASINNDDGECSPTAGYEVCGGTHTAELFVSEVGAESDAFNATITVQYVPFNGVGDPKSFFPDCIIFPFEGEEQQRVDKE